jgi:hypothetical protein
VHYCGVVPMQSALQLALLEEVRDPEPPIRLSALFYEPGSATQVAEEIGALGDVVVGVGAPVAGGESQEPLAARGVPPQPPHPEVERLVEALGMPVFEDDEGPVPEGAYQDYPLFETNADGVFFALQGRRLPAKRHPYGMQLRLDELAGDRVTDEGGDLWHRRIEEVDAAACALCAHRYAVGHAYSLGALVLPGSGLPDTFPSRGVLPPVERINLP